MHADNNYSSKFNFFSSKRERNLWLLVFVVQAGIFVTAGWATQVADILRDYDLQAVFFILGMVLCAAAITLLSIQRKPAVGTIGMITAVIAVYWMVWVRIKTLEERSHLFEYSLVGVLLYQAMIERRKHGGKVPMPAFLAILVTALLGLADEGLQAFIPSRYFDIRDVGFNALAGLMAVGSSVILAWLEKWWKNRGKTRESSHHLGE